MTIKLALECVGGPYDGETHEGSQPFTVTRPIPLEKGFGQVTMGRYAPQVWPPVGLVRLVWQEAPRT